MPRNSWRKRRDHSNALFAAPVQSYLACGLMRVVVRTPDPKPWRRGRPREGDFREVINAVRYLVRSGGGWRMLPIQFGPWQTVYSWFRELARRFLFQTIHDMASMLDRDRAGREVSPSAVA
jgi:transposase